MFIIKNFLSGENEGVQFIVHMIPSHLPDYAHQVAVRSSYWYEELNENMVGNLMMKFAPGFAAKWIFDKCSKIVAEFKNEWYFSTKGFQGDYFF